MKIVSYNVRYFSHALRGLASTRRSSRAIAAALDALEPRPQIVCLQEAASAQRFDAFVRALGRPYRAHHFPVHTSRLYRTGLAILVDEEHFTVDGDGVVALTHEGTRGERRACAHVDLRDRSGEPLHVFNAHLSLPSPLGVTRLGHGANQLAQAQCLSAIVRKVAGPRPFILCGDFNARPSSPVHRCFADALSAPAHDGPTARIGPWRGRLDYLFGGNGVRWLGVDNAARFDGLSDHTPLIARFAGS
jgi:endonuclease/exonuclease/phosphatase family metal-dependent hydrolase